MSDAAEDWLRENDPQYAVTSQAWKHVKTGEYKTPRQEIPWGGASDLALLLNGGYDYAEPLEDRACAVCGDTFSPREAKHVHCGNACKQRAYRRRK